MTSPPLPPTAPVATLNSPFRAAVRMSDEDVLRVIRLDCVQLVPVGSRVTCEPPPVDTDADYLAMISDPHHFAMFEKSLFNMGFTLDGSLVLREGSNLNDPEFFQSYKLGQINIIATCSIEFFDLFMLATKLAKRFNLMNKADRIALFQAVLYQVENSELTA